MEELAQSLVGPICGICGFLFLCWVLSHLWRRPGCSGGSGCIENVERNDGGVNCEHKVFLCHSGEQKDFVEWMYDEIRSHDRSAFFDKSRGCLAVGCDFPREIFKAIEECEVGVVVLSKAFFTKTWWPMVEFARLAKRKEENKDFVIVLVLYDIELAECRDLKKQREWKKQWNKWARSDKRIVIADWTSVFKLIGPILSISCDKVGGAKRVIGEVVAEVCKRVLLETRGDDLDMQGRERICELVCAKRQASEESGGDGPCMLGMYEVGGIGKSTVCKALCEKLGSDFGGRVCHAEFATSSDDGQEKEMLEEMVKTLIGMRHVVVGGYNKMKLLNLLMGKLRDQRVLLALDNVGDGASTKELARALLKARFAKESFVVVTARTIEMLEDVGVSEKECHEMPELEYEEAKRIFLNKAPKGLDLEDALLEKCVRMCYFLKGDGERCHYHPLALKVLGGQLGSDPEEWGVRLKGRDRFNALREKLRALKRKSLIECVGDGTKRVGMHDLWREFCETEITRGDVRDRFWFYRMDKMHESIEEGMFYNGGCKNLRRVCLKSCYRWKETMQVKRVNMQLCANLIVLKLVNVDVENQVSDMSPLVQLRSLEVQLMNKQAPIDIQGLGLLRDLCVLIWLGTPKNLASIAEIAGLVHLQVLMFIETDQYGLRYGLSHEISRLANLSDFCCLELVTLRMGSLPRHLEWSSMANLQYLDLMDSKGMCSCNGLEDLVALVELDLNGCWDLEALPFLGKLTKLEKLGISFSEVAVVPGLECLVALKEV